jgi:hypothetical protein
LHSAAAADSEHSAEKIQQQIQQRRSSSRFRTFSREDPAADSEHSAEDPAADSEHSAEDPAADSEHSAEDPAADLAADAPTIKDSLFRPHPLFSQPSKEDYEQNFAATRAQLSSIFERVS